MKRFGCLSPSVVLLLVLALLPLSAPGAEKPLALVNGEPVTMADYRLFLLKLPPDTAGKEVDKELLRRLVDERLILQEARRRGMSVTDDEVRQSIEVFLQENKISEKAFEEQITAKGMSLQRYRAWLKDDIIPLAKIVHQEVDDKVTVEDEEIHSYYAANKDRFAAGPERVRIKAIFLRLEEDATLAEVTALKIKTLRLVSQLRRGTGFDALSDLYPENPLKPQDGALGEFRKGDLVPALERGIDALKEGQVSPPLWMKDGVYIIRLEGRERAIAPLDGVRQDIRNRVFYEKRSKLYTVWVKTLWERSAVTIY